MPLGKIATAAFVAMALALAASSQTPPAAKPFTYVTAKELEALVAKPNPNGGATSSMLDKRESFSEQVVSRTVDGAVEAHGHWIDYITILAGDVTLTVGGSITGDTVDDLGESHGGAQTGGTVLSLHAGDYVSIPAGTPHRMTAPKGLRYLAIKVRV